MVKLQLCRDDSSRGCAMLDEQLKHTCSLPRNSRDWGWRITSLAIMFHRKESRGAEVGFPLRGSWAERLPIGVRVNKVWYGSVSAQAADPGFPACTQPVSHGVHGYFRTPFHFYPSDSWLSSNYSLPDLLFFCGRPLSKWVPSKQ
jgi:hypothetical protein